jgi:hypothetical protein
MLKFREVTVSCLVGNGVDPVQPLRHPQPIGRTAQSITIAGLGLEPSSNPEVRDNVWRQRDQFLMPPNFGAWNDQGISGGCNPGNRVCQWPQPV